MSPSDEAASLFDRGIKKLFGSYTCEDEDGNRVLDEATLKVLAEDMEMVPTLLLWEEFLEAFMQSCRSKDAITHHEFKKGLKKVAVVEYKKKRYANRYISHDHRYTALCEYLDAGEVESLLARAKRGPATVAAKRPLVEKREPVDARDVQEETIEERIERRTRQQLAQLNEERRIAELARKEREALMAAPPAPSSPKQQQQPSHGDVGGWDDHNGGSRSLDDLPTMPGTQGPHEAGGARANRHNLSDEDELLVDDDDGESVDGLDNSIVEAQLSPAQAPKAGHEERAAYGGSSGGGGVTTRPQSGGRRPASGRPQSAGRGKGVRPESAKPESAKNQLRAQAVAGAVGVLGAGMIVGSADTASANRQGRSRYHLRFVLGGKTADLHIAGDIAWPGLCAQVSSLLSTSKTHSLEFTYKAAGAEGRPATVVCSGEEGLRTCLNWIDSNPPKGGVTRCSLVTPDEDEDEGGREGADMMTELRGFGGSLERFKGDLETRAVYTPACTQSQADDRVVYTSSSASPRGEPKAGSWVSRPPRPQSVTSRPLSAPRSTLSEPEYLPRPSSASSVGLARPRDDAGGGLYRGEGSGTRGGEMETARGKRADGGVYSEMSSRMGGQAAVGGGAPKGVHDKLASCIALGVLTSHSDMHIEVEHCTARRPSITLRGSSKKYTQYYEELRREVRDGLRQWRVECRTASAKPRIGAFEVSMWWTHNGYPYSVCLFSKLGTRLWPSARLLVGGLSEVLPQANEIVQIRITDDDGGRGIPDTHIVIQDPDSDQVIRSAVTASDGTADLSIAEGMYSVTVQAVGFSQWQALLTLHAAEGTVIRLCSSPRSPDMPLEGVQASP